MNTDYLVLVNGDHALPVDYQETVELLTAENCEGKCYGVEKKTYEAFLRLREDLLRNHGIQAELISGHRTIEAQINSFNNYLNKFGLEYANKYVAKPGHSEHHTGLAIDVGILREGRVYFTIEDLLSVDDLFQIIHKKLPDYGFILRYPADKKPVTGIGYEPWHFRYIDSPEIARQMADEGICFEEYWQIRRNGK